MGDKRLGTSLLRLILNSHSGIATGPESKFKYLKLLGKIFLAQYVHIVHPSYNVIISSIKRNEHNGIRTVLAWFLSIEEQYL